MGFPIKLCKKCKKVIFNKQTAIEIVLAKPNFKKHLKSYGARKRKIIESYHKNCYKPIDSDSFDSKGLF